MRTPILTLALTLLTTLTHAQGTRAEFERANTHLLKGDLLLTVGELDQNVVCRAVPGMIQDSVGLPIA